MFSYRRILVFRSFFKPLMPLVHQALTPLIHIQDKYCACCFVFISLYLIFSLQIFLALRFINLVLSSPKWIVNLLSINQSGIFSESWVFFQFPQCLYVGISSPRMERWGTFFISFTFTRLYLKLPPDLKLDSTLMCCWNLIILVDSFEMKTEWINQFLFIKYQL